MEATFDLVIRGGMVVDGSGGEPFRADVAIDGRTIAAVGRITGKGREEIDASGKLVTLNKGDMTKERFSQGALAEWDHSAWERREIIHAGADKVHVDTRFTRYRKDGSVIGGFDSVYVITKENGHWGVKIRSSFAP